MLKLLHYSKSELYTYSRYLRSVAAVNAEPILTSIATEAALIDEDYESFSEVRADFMNSGDIKTEAYLRYIHFYEQSRAASTTDEKVEKVKLVPADKFSNFGLRIPEEYIDLITINSVELDADIIPLTKKTGTSIVAGYFETVGDVGNEKFTKSNIEKSDYTFDSESSRYELSIADMFPSLSLADPSYIKGTIKLVITYKGEKYIVSQDIEYIVSSDTDMAVSKAEQHTVSVTVVDDAGSVAEGVYISVAGMRCITDSNGECSISGIITGTYTIVVESDDFYDEETLQVQDDITLNIDMGDDDEDSDNGLFQISFMSGSITFQDGVPDDAWIRVTPASYMINGSWKAVNCEVASDGSFGSVCYSDLSDSDMSAAMSVDGEFFQVVVYSQANDDMRMNADESVYFYIDDVDYGYWNNFTVDNGDSGDSGDSDDSGNSSEISLPDSMYGSSFVSSMTSWHTSGLTNPSSPDSWYDGTEETITWNTTQITGSTVSLYIIWDDYSEIMSSMSSSADVMKSAISSRLWGRFANGISNTGSLTIDPASLYSNGDYIMLIVSDNGDWDISNNSFSVSNSSSGDDSGDTSGDSGDSTGGSGDTGDSSDTGGADDDSSGDNSDDDATVEVDDDPTLDIVTTANLTYKKDFYIRLAVSDDIGVGAVAGVVYTKSGSYTGVYFGSNVSGTNLTLSYKVEVNDLESGNYKIKIGAKDISGQNSEYKYYYFSKE
jgi:hypothetical protein